MLSLCYIFGLRIHAARGMKDYFNSGLEYYESMFEFDVWCVACLVTTILSYESIIKAFCASVGERGRESKNNKALFFRGHCLPYYPQA